MQVLTQAATEHSVTAADVGDLRLQAQRRLPRFLFDYIDGGSYAETTLRRNVDDLQSIAVRQRVMRDVSEVSTTVRLFDFDAAMPLALGPVGLAGLYARRGEVQAAQAAEAARIPFTLSTVSACPLDEVTAAVRTAPWFQLYVIKDRAFMGDLLARAAAAGVNTLFLTVDLPMNGARYRDVRTGLTAGQGMAAELHRFGQIAARPGWAWDVGVMGRPHTLGNVAPAMPPGTGLFKFFDWVGRNFDPTITWKDLDWIRETWKGRLVIKGLLEAEDARLALAAGADGVVVSNHGGRQLDGVPSTISVLPEIAAAVQGRVPVLMDGGVRSGLDVIRAIALGASGVLVGRAWAYGLAAGGRQGVADMLEIVRKEMAVAMALAGLSRVSDIGPDCLR